ncbi:hypothetical protein ACWFNE_12785 [Cellulomonas sp. NPDC055163]
MESVLTGAWVERPRLPAVLRWVGVMFGSVVPGSVRIPGGDGRTYSAPMPAAVSSGWLARLPVVEEPGRDVPRRGRP